MLKVKVNEKMMFKGELKNVGNIIEVSETEFKAYNRNRNFLSIVEETETKEENNENENKLEETETKEKKLKKLKNKEAK